MRRPRDTLRAYYEGRLAEHGATHLGVDWRDADGLLQRFAVMTDLFAGAPGELSVLDLGCGVGFYADYLAAYHPARPIRYTGIDISPQMIEAARRRHPSLAFEARDLLADPLPDESFDYVVVNGIFTIKERLSYEAMKAFVEALLTRAFRVARRGIAANFMTKHVDWEKDRLFHLPFDEAAAFMKRELTRHLVFRADYGLWEYTAYAYHAPRTLETKRDEAFLRDVLKLEEPT